MLLRIQLFIAILIAPATMSFGQCSNTCGSNLVQNGGFETPTSSCSTSDIQLYSDQSPVLNWFGTDPYSVSPMTGSTPDYFSPCAGSTNASNSPCITGNARLGFFTKTSGTNAREYLQSQLASPLVAGRTYCFSMVVKSKVGSAGNILSSCDGVGAWFHNQGIINIQTMNAGAQYLGPGSTVNANPQVQNPSGNLIGSSCVTVTGTFCANGGEDYIVIGNFRNDANTQISGSNPSNYMYVDELTLYELCPPTLNLTASPANITCGGSSTLTVTSTFPAGTVYNWIAPGGNSLSGTGPITVNPSTTTTYTLVATFTTSCGIQTDTSSVTVTVGPCGVSAIVYDTLICNGQCHDLYAYNVQGGLSPYSFSWTDASGNSIGNTAGPVQVCPSANTFFSLVVTDANGQQFTDTITVTVVPYPVVSAGTDTSICSGQQVQLNGQSNSGQISWSGLGNNSIYSVNPSITTTYIFSADSSGCVSSDSVTITVNPFPTMTKGSSNITCFGDNNGEAWIAPAGTYTVSWTPGGITTDSIHHLAPGMVYVTVSNAAGCSVQDSVLITQPPVLVTSISGNSTLCSGSSTLLHASTTGGTPSYTYDWQSGQHTPDIIASPTASTIVHLLTTDANGCSQIDSISIVVHPVPQAAFSGGINMCSGTDTIVLNSSTGANSYSWFVNGIGAGTSSNLYFDQQQTGCFDLQLIATNGFGCSDTASVFCAVEVLQNPVASISVSSAVMTLDNPLVSFTNNSENSTSCIWYIDHQFFHNGCDHNLNYSSEILGFHQVELVTANDAGCRDTAFVTIEVREGLIYYVPNAFTPDGDENNNTFFPVFTSGFDPSSYHFSIYDRWGEHIFESYDNTIGWDGTYQGKICSDGIYTWTIQFKDLYTDKIYQRQGSVALVR